MTDDYFRLSNNHCFPAVKYYLIGCTQSPLHLRPFGSPDNSENPVITETEETEVK